MAELRDGVERWLIEGKFEWALGEENQRLDRTGQWTGA
jgi:hypothetical protein